MAVDFSYPNARIRAMRSHLFDHDFYHKLLEIEETPGLISAFQQTIYQSNIEEGTLKYPGTLGVEEAFRKNITETFTKILNMVDGQVKELVEVLLGRWDVHSLKTILRGKNVGASTEEIIDSLIPAGQLSEIFLTELAKQPDIKAVIDLLVMARTPYAKPLSNAFPHYAQTKNLVRLELALDEFFYSYALERTSVRLFDAQLVHQVLKREIDVINVMTILRMVQQKVKEQDKVLFFIEGGKYIDRELFVDLVENQDVEGVIHKLEKTPYGAVLKEAQGKFMETGALSVIERSLEKLQVRQNTKLFRADPLSIALIIAYIWAKYNEIINLRIIVRGKALGMPSQKIKEDLVLV